MNKQKIEDVLLKLGITPNINGFGYITDAILIMSEDDDLKMMELYYEIAKRNHCKTHQVERSIRHALQKSRSFSKSDPEIVEYYLGFADTKNSASLKRLLLILQREQGG